MAHAASPSSSADDLKKHVMEVFKEATKYCEDKDRQELFGMIQDYNDLKDYALLVLDNLDDNPLLELRCMADDTFVEEAKELFKPSSESNVLRDVAVFTIVISRCASFGMTEAAHKVYQHMIASGVAPTSCTYTILIRALARYRYSYYFDVNFVGYAKKYFLEMLDKGMKPHSASYMSVFRAIAFQESFEKAREFREQIKAKGFSPESNVYDFDTETMNPMNRYHDLIITTERESWDLLVQFIIFFLILWVSMNLLYYCR